MTTAAADHSNATTVVGSLVMLSTTEATASTPLPSSISTRAYPDSRSLSPARALKGRF